MPNVPKVRKSSPTACSEPPALTRSVSHFSSDQYITGLVRGLANKVEASASRFCRTHFDVGLSGWYLLAALATAPSSDSATLCAKASLDKGAVSRCLAQMDEAGLVLIRHLDGRRRSVALTPKGRRLHDRMARAILAREEQLLAEFSHAQVKALIDLLTRLEKSAASLTQEGPKPTDRTKAIDTNRRRRRSEG